QPAGARAPARARCPVARRAARAAWRSARRGPPSAFRWRVLPLALDLPHLGLHAKKGIDHARIEMPPCLCSDVFEGALLGPGGLVGPHRGQRVVDVRHRDDAGAERNMIADQAVRIARALVLLVVAERDEGPHAYVLRGAAF